MKTIMITKRRMDMKQWPNTSIDLEAWERAKEEMPFEVNLSVVAQRAQVIKDELKRGVIESNMERDRR